ncbi:MAG: thioesterase family protein [Phycisphaerales bacterium]
MPATNPDHAVLEGPAELTEVRVRYCECDPMGVAHHASFVPWLEMARTEALRSAGRTYAQMEAEGVFLVVTRLEVSYKRPARYDDVLRIACRASIAGRARLRHDYAIHVVEPGDGQAGRAGDRPVVTATTELACVDGSGRPTPMPAWLVEIVEGRS